MKSKLLSFCLTLLISHFSFGQIKMEDLRIDTTITGFHYAADFSGTRIFTKNGPADLEATNPSAFSFTLMPNATYDSALQQLNFLMALSERYGFTISDVVKKDSTLNGYKSYILSYTETQTEIGYKNLVFNAFVMKENTAIIFISGDLDNGKYTNKYKQTFYALKP